MRIARIVLCASGLALIVSAQRISVRELPPEAIPHGSCTQGHSGYLGVEASNRFKLSGEEIGKYVVEQLKEGYSLQLYPQESGRIFSIATCESSVAPSR
jgi:hypothetical protein